MKREEEGGLLMGENKTEILRLRITPELKKKFIAACEAAEETPSRILHDYVKAFVKAANEEESKMTTYQMEMKRFLDGMLEEYGAKYFSMEAESELKGLFAKEWQNGGLTAEKASEMAKKAFPFQMYDGNVLGFADTAELRQKSLFARIVEGDAISIMRNPVLKKSLFR